MKKTLPKAWLLTFVLGLRGDLAIALVKYPAALLLYGMIAGFAPAVLAPNRSLWYQILYSLLLLLPALILPWRKSVVVALAMLMGLGLTPLYDSLLPDAYLKILSGRDRGAEIEVRVSDPACAGTTLPWLNNPYLIRCEVISIKLHGEIVTRASSGLVAVVLPRDSTKVKYGEILTLRGVFRCPEGKLRTSCRKVYGGTGGEIDFEPFATSRYGEFNFNNYLLARGMSRVFYVADVIKTTSQPNSFYASLMQFRDIVMSKIATGISKEESKAMLATLIFGYRQGLEPETRTAFIWSGTIHIFSVGGMHVVILAWLLFWLLRPLGFRCSHIVIPLLAGVYVLAAGAEPPAVRSLLMITIWSWCRAWLRYTPGLNLVFAAAVVVLAFNPYYLMDVGVQYSFITVIFLIASGAPVRLWQEAGMEVKHWIPPRDLPRFRYLCNKKIIGAGVAVVGCALAWLVSSGISLYYQGIYTPISIVANILILPFVSWLFVISGIKLILTPLPWLGDFCTTLIELTLNAIVGICTFCYESFENVPMMQPQWWALLIFYGALATMLLFRRHHRIFWGMLILMCGLIIWWRLAPITAPSEAVILSGGASQEPCLLICPPHGLDPIVVNVPSWEVAQRLVNRLRHRGINAIDRVILAGNRKDYCAGLGTLSTALRIQQLDTNKPAGANSMLSATLSRLDPTRTAVTVHHDNIAITDSVINFVEKKGGWMVEYRCVGFHITADISEERPGRRAITIKNGNTELKTTIVNSNVLEERTLVFK